MCLLSMYCRVIPCVSNTQALHEHPVTMQAMAHSNLSTLSELGWSN